jgi:hypothetical protein
MKHVDLPIISSDPFLDLICCIHYKIPLDILININQLKLEIEKEIQENRYDKYMYSLYSGNSIKDVVHEFNKSIGQLT